MSTGGSPSGGALGSGGASSGGSASGGAASGGASSGGSGGGEADEFTLAMAGFEGSDNDDCTPDAPTTCPLFLEENVATFIGGDNISPAMAWQAGPEGTLSYAITLYDLSSNTSHWALWDIPAGTLELPPGLPSGASLTTPVVAKQAGFTTPSYTGSGMCLNVYEFRVYALATATFDVGGATDAAGVIPALEAATPLDTSFVRLQSRDYCE